MPAKDTIKYKFMSLSEAKEVYIVIKRTTKNGSGITWFGVMDNLLTLAGSCYGSDYTKDWAAHIIADIETKSIRSDFNYNTAPNVLHKYRKERYHPLGWCINFLCIVLK